MQTGPYQIIYGRYNDILNLFWRRNCPNFPKIVPDLKYEVVKSELYFKDRETIICTREAKLEIVCDKKDSIDKKLHGLVLNILNQH